MRSAVGVIGVELVLAAAAGVALLASGLRAAPARADRATGGWRFAALPVNGAAEGRCAFDLGGGPVRVTVEPWAGAFEVVASASDGRAISRADQRSAPEGLDVVLALRGQATPGGARVVVSPTPRGEVIQRRRATTAERFAAADQARRGDQCGPAGLDFPAAPSR